MGGEFDEEDTEMPLSDQGWIDVVSGATAD